MEAKWPFMLITFFLIFALGLTISTLERKSVMNNWSTRRCDLPVTMAAMFFKPDNDPRSRTEFATDNFDFCMKSYIDNFMKIFMMPINTLFGKQTNLTGSAVDMVSTIRKITATLYSTLSGYLDTYYRKFNASVYEMSRVVQYLRMAMRRLNGTVMSMLYSGLTLFRGMLNTIQFIIKVVLIICGIMLAIIIILIFVLFPFIPMILAALGAIVSTVLALVMVISGELGSEANSDKSGFCFGDNTYIDVIRNNIQMKVNVKDININDILANNCGRVTAIIKMDGAGVQMYSINGIHVSGSHVVLGTDNIWKCVSSDERAIKLDNKYDILYCFNTTTHNIPVFSNELNNNIIFRDWEEIDDDDILGQNLWTYTILKILNNDENYDIWKSSLKTYKNFPLMGSSIKIKTLEGFVELSKLSLFDEIMDRMGNKQKILGVIHAEIDGFGNDTDKWNTEMYEYDDKNRSWIKGQSTVINGNNKVYGLTLIVETGEFIIFDEVEQREKIVRDFTEIGHNEIYKTYSLVNSRLRLFRTRNDNI
jgi:hypothetical protein